MVQPDLNRSVSVPAEKFRKTNLQRKFKQECVDYKGGKCCRCGYKKCLGALEFHHRDPSQKDFAVGSIKKETLTDKIKSELDKCDLLCSNCHKEEHYK